MRARGIELRQMEKPNTLCPPKQVADLKMLYFLHKIFECFCSELRFCICDFLCVYRELGGELPRRLQQRG